MPKARSQGQSLVLWLEFRSRKKSRLWTLGAFQVWTTKLLFVVRRGTESILTRSFWKAGSRIPQVQEAKVAGTVPTVPRKPPPLLRVMPLVSRFSIRQLDVQSQSILSAQA